MECKINFVTKAGTSSITVSGETVEDIKEKALEEDRIRNSVYSWSEEIKEGK